MEIYLNIIINIGLGVLGTFSIYLLFDLFYEVKSISIKKTIILFGVYNIITDMSYYFLNIPIITLSINIISLLYIAWQYKKDIKKALIIVAIIYLSLGAAEALILSIIKYENFHLTKSNPLVSLEYIFIAKLITFIAVLLIRNFKIAKENYKINYKQWIIILTVSLIAIYIIVNLLGYRSIGIWPRTISIVGMIVINLSIIYLYISMAKSSEKQLKLALYEKEIKYYKNQFALLEKSRKLDKSLYHDMNNILIGLKSMASNEKANTVIEYIDGFKKNYQLKEEYSKSGNTIIDSILNYKLAEAKANDIKFELKIKVPTDIKLDGTDISVILGNLLDNAVEALIKVPVDKRILKIEIEYKMKRIFIKIENYYNGCVKIKNNELKSLKENEQNHGLGIASVKRISEKYGGYIDIKHTDEKFIVKISICENQL